MDLSNNLGFTGFNPPITEMVPSSVGIAAFNDAVALSMAASALYADTTKHRTLSGTPTITGNGGLNVIHIGSVNNAPLPAVGGPTDTFVFKTPGR